MADLKSKYGITGQISHKQQQLAFWLFVGGIIAVIAAVIFLLPPIREIVTRSRLGDAREVEAMVVSWELNGRGEDTVSYFVTYTFDALRLPDEQTITVTGEFPTTSPRTGDTVRILYNPQDPTIHQPAVIAEQPAGGVLNLICGATILLLAVGAIIASRYARRYDLGQMMQDSLQDSQAFQQAVQESRRKRK